MVRNTSKIFIAMLFILFFPLMTQAESLSKHVSGTFKEESVHFSAADNKYILKGSIEIKNNSKEDLSGLMLAIEFPKESGPAFSSVDPIEIGDIDAKGKLKEDVQFEIIRSEVGANRDVNFAIVVEEGILEYEKIADLGGTADISVMKDSYSEVDAALTGEVVENGDDYSLKIKVSGTNQSIYPFKTDDKIYIGFHLPYNLSIDLQAAEEEVYATPSGGTGELFVVPIDAEAEADFEFEYTLPLTGELSVNTMNNLNADLMLLTHDPNHAREFIPTGTVKGEAEIDFSAMYPEDEETIGDADHTQSETNEKTDESTEAAAKLDNQQTSETFFGKPFYTGLGAGAVGGILLGMLVKSRRKHNHTEE